MKSILMCLTFISIQAFAFNEYDNVEWDKVIQKNKDVQSSLILVKKHVGEISSDFDIENKDQLQTVSCDGMLQKKAKSRMDKEFQGPEFLNECGLFDFGKAIKANRYKFSFGYEYALCPHAWVDKLSWKRDSGSTINVEMEYHLNCERNPTKTDAKRKKFEVSARSIDEDDLLKEADDKANEKVIGFLNSLSFSIKAGDNRTLESVMQDSYKVLSSFKNIKESDVESAYKNKLNEFCGQAKKAYGSGYNGAGYTLGQVKGLCDPYVYQPQAQQTPKPAVGETAPATSGPSRTDDDSDDSED